MPRTGIIEVIEKQMNQMHIDGSSPGGKNRKRGNKRTISPLSVNKNKVGNNLDPETEALEREIQFKTELIWCRDNIEERIRNLPDNFDLRRKAELIKAFNNLSNDRLGLVQKRVIMSQHCGDYRQKMAQELANFRRQHPCVSVVINNQTSKVNSPMINDATKGLVVRKRLKTSNTINEISTLTSINPINNSSEFKFNLPEPSK